MDIRDHSLVGRASSHSQCVIRFPAISRRSQFSVAQRVYGLSYLFGLSVDPRDDAHRGSRAKGKRSLRGARSEIMEHPLELRGIKDPRVLAAMEKVDRRMFVPKDVRPLAYADRALPIGCEQTISQPYIVGLMSELLDLRGTERVLEIGTGSGYQTAVLGELAKEVYSIEIIPELAKRAARLLKDLGYLNIRTRIGDGTRGWPEAAPFDAITVTCSPEHVPESLIEQLKEGGRLVIPLGIWTKPQQLVLMIKQEGKMESRPIIPVSFVPMTGSLQ